MNELQRAIGKDYLAMLQEERDRSKILKSLAREYGTGMFEIEGILHRAIQEGLNQPYLGDKKSRNRFLPRDPVQMMLDQEKRINHLEAQLRYMGEAIQASLDNAETLALSMMNVRKVAGRLRGRSGAKIPRGSVIKLLEDQRAV